nr:hypothetical protein [uncultured Rhodopila sp.]
MDGGGFAFDYFISRRGTAAALAREAADALAAAGYKVRVQDYDFAASGQFVRDIDGALRQCRHLHEGGKVAPLAFRKIFEKMTSRRF